MPEGTFAFVRADETNTIAVPLFVYLATDINKTPEMFEQSPSSLVTVIGEKLVTSKTMFGHPPQRHF